MSGKYVIQPLGCKSIEYILKQWIVLFARFDWLLNQ